MRLTVLAAVLVLLAEPAAFARGGIRPSFAPDRCAWEASHVVVVSEGDSIDGVVRVLESWKGDLKPGDSVAVPELAAFAPPAARTVSPEVFDRNPAPLPPVSGGRMVLFLIRSPAEGGQPRWLPADTLWKRFDVSAAWVEAGRVFAFEQQINPGPSQLVRTGLDERALKGRVDAVVAAQADLSRAVEAAREPDLSATVVRLLASDSGYVVNRVYRALSAAGPAALPALRAILADQKRLSHHPSALEALATAGGPAVGPELAAVLGRELEFWRVAGPGLKSGWWNGAGVEWAEVERLRTHYSLALAAVRGMKAVRFVGGRATATEFRDLWRSRPQLKDVGSDQVGVECDDYLAGK